MRLHLLKTATSCSSCSSARMSLREISFRSANVNLSGERILRRGGRTLAPPGNGLSVQREPAERGYARAKCLAIVVASPALFVPECRSPRQMRLANAFCRLREMAGSDDKRSPVSQS